MELDGGQHQDRMGYDAERTAWLSAMGFEVVRLWNNEFLEDRHARRGSGSWRGLRGGGGRWWVVGGCAAGCSSALTPTLSLAGEGV